MLSTRPIYKGLRKRVYITGTDRMKVEPLSSVVDKDQLPGDDYFSRKLL